MRKYELSLNEPGKLVAQLEPHVGTSVTVRVAHGREIDGILDDVGPRRILVSGQSITIADVRWCIVRDGGDWVTKGGHSSATRTERIHLRCSHQQKKKLSAAATRAGKPLSSYVLDLALGV